MRITSILEDKKIEKRIAVTPDVAKKYINLGFELSLPENYGLHLGISDSEYKEIGVGFLKDEKELINSSDIIIQLGLPSDDKLSLFRENQYSYLLYPNKELPGFLKKNVISKNLVKGSKLLEVLIKDGNTQLIKEDCNGVFHFNGNFNKSICNLEKIAYVTTY